MPNARALIPAIWLASLAPAGGRDTTIRLQPFEDHRVLIQHAGLEAEWQFRFPEVVAAQEGTFLTSPRTRMIWREYPDGTWGYDWQTTNEYAAFAYDQVAKRIPMIVGMQISPRILVKPDRLELSLTLKNISTRTFHDVNSDGGCLQHRTPRFFDDDHRLTSIQTSQGVTPLDHIDRSLPVRAKYFFNPGWYEDPTTQAYEFFWGRSRTRPTAPWIASRAATGKGAIGIAWEQCTGLRQSSDDGHRCMHSSPYFGDLKAGKSMTRHGVILFGDRIEEVIKALEKERFSIYSSPPQQKGN